MSEAEEAAKRLREIGAISANWAMTDEAEIRRTCRKAADTIERQTERVKALEQALEWIVEDGCSDARAVACARAALQGTAG